MPFEFEIIIMMGSFPLKHSEKLFVLLPVEFSDGKWGYINSEGELVIEPKFEKAWAFKEGLAVVLYKGKYGAINREGEFVIEPRFIDLTGPSEGLFAFALKKGRMGYMDTEGNIVIKPVFKAAQPFHEGRAFVQLREWERTYYFENPEYLVQLLKAIKGKGRVTTPPFSEFRKFPWREALRRKKFPRFSRAEKVAFINKEGEFIIKGEFHGYFSGCLIPYFSEGKAIISYEKNEFETEAYFINRDGEIVLGPFEDGCNFSEGYAYVRKDGWFGFINTEGKFVFEPYFSFWSLPKYFKEGLLPLLFHLEGGICRWSSPPPDENPGYYKWGYIDKNFRLAITPRYDYAENFSEGLAAVLVGDYWGYIDRKGQMVIEPRFEIAYPFEDGVAEVAIDGTWGYINRRGELIWPPHRNMYIN